MAILEQIGILCDDMNEDTCSGTFETKTQVCRYRWSDTQCIFECEDLSFLERKDVVDNVRNKTVIISILLLGAGALLYTGKKLW